MNNIYMGVIRKIVFIIQKFNKDNDVKYMELNNISSLEEFIKVNGDFILETIEFIEVYLGIYNRLNDMNISGIEVSSSDIYEPKYLELLIDSYEKNGNNYIIKNILFNQTIAIYKNLEKCKREIWLINKILNIYYELLESNNLNTYNSSVIKLLKLLDDDNDDSESTEGGTLEDLLNEFSIVLKNSYGVKKKNVKIKVLKR